MNFTKDLTKFVTLLEKHNVAYMVIGGAAVNIHGYSRSTGDLDIWFKPDEDNFQKLQLAITDFGFVVPTQLQKLEYIRNRGLIRLPLDRFYIEFLPDLGKKFDFDELLSRGKTISIADKVTLVVIGYDDLIALKISAHRPKDMEDIRVLERLRNRERKKISLLDKLKKFLGLNH